MKKNRVVYVIFIIFCVVGTGLLIGGALCGWHFASFKAKAEEITGEITRIEEYYDSDYELKHSVYVSYNYDGIDYEDVSINFYSSSMYEGKEIGLLCDPEKPYYVEERTSGTLVVAILAGIGIIFLLVGAIPLFVMAGKKRQNKELLLNGQVLYATVERIDYNLSVAVNGRHPFVIFCSYRDEYKDITYRFKSGSLWTDPSPVFSPGSTIKVYVKPTDYSKYYVDAEQVLEEKVVDFT